MDDNTKVVLLAAIPALGSIFTVIANRYFGNNRSCEDVNGKESRGNDRASFSGPSSGGQSPSDISTTKITSPGDRSIAKDPASSGSAGSTGKETARPDT